MPAKRAMTLLVSLTLLGALTMGAQAQPPEDRGRPEDAGSDRGRSAEGNETDNDTDEDRGRAGPPDHARERSNAQGRALGLDQRWHECRSAAGDNETDKKECHDAAMQRAIERHDAIKAARANGSVGGELNISRNGTEIDNETDIDISVDRGNASDLRVEVGAELDRGQTIVLDVDPEMFDEDGQLVIEYYDVPGDGRPDTLNTSFSEADSLQDALDPDDDDGAEYWTIHDHEGYHVLVSIPDWSVHAVTIQSEEADVASASNIPAMAVGAVIAVFVSMTVMLWWQRPGRRD